VERFFCCKIELWSKELKGSVSIKVIEICTLYTVHCIEAGKGTSPWKLGDFTTLKIPQAVSWRSSAFRAENFRMMDIKINA